MDFILKQDIGIAIFGRIGSGKSWEAFSLQEQLLKNQLKCVTLTPIRSAKDKWVAKNTCYLDGLQLTVKQEASLMINKIMQLGNYTVFVDEAHMVFDQYIDASNKTEDRSLSAFVRQRRHRNVGLVIIDQRPARIYPTALAQCDYIISFRQKYPDDIERLAEITNPDFAQATTTLNFDNHDRAIYDMKHDTFEIFNGNTT